MSGPLPPAGAVGRETEKRTGKIIHLNHPYLAFSNSAPSLPIDLREPECRACREVREDYQSNTHASFRPHTLDPYQQQPCCQNQLHGPFVHCIKTHLQRAQKPFVCATSVYFQGTGVNQRAPKGRVIQVERGGDAASSSSCCSTCACVPTPGSRGKE